jgi:uncharacterized protein (TIGR03067 family)
MLARLLLAGVVLGTLTAFAPAPLPKKERKKGDSLTLERLRGVWVVQKVEQSSKGGYQRSSDNLAEVRIEGSRWTFVSGRGGPPQVGRTLDLTIDANHKPAWFDLGQNGKSQTSGIVKLQGDELRVLYQWGRPRPGSFENPPEGYWHIIFKQRK